MQATIADVTGLAERLRLAEISYRLQIVRPDALMFQVAVPGERWEIEFLSDGQVEVEVFKSDGTIADKRSIDALFERFSDDA